MTTAMAKLETAAGEGEKARIAAEKLRAQVAGLQESNDKYKEVGMGSIIIMYLVNKFYWLVVDYLKIPLQGDTSRCVPRHWFC